jgi:hypothetical protein
MFGWALKDSGQKRDLHVQERFFRPGGVAMPVILAVRRLKQEDCEFEANLGYIVRLCPKKTKPKYIMEYELVQSTLYIVWNYNRTPVYY